MLAIVAAVSVTTLIIHMWRTGRRIKANIEGRLESSAERAGRAAFLGVLGFTILMITREGMETALLMNTLLFQMSNAALLAGAIAGTIAAAGVAWLWSRYGHRVNLARFFQVTAVFLFVFVVQLLIYGFHELTEANIGIPNSEALHWATEPYGPDGIYGQYLTYLLVHPADRLAGRVEPLAAPGRNSGSGHPGVASRQQSVVSSSRFSATRMCWPELELLAR